MPLTPEQWGKVKELVASALELPTEDRKQFLDSACQDNRSLLLEAVSLLQYATDLRNPASRLLKNRYRVDSELGRGGFATTYLAFDQDLHNRRVVVKMLSDSHAEPYIYRKFEDEIRALSILEHPNIITPLDCGRTEKDVPFLVMQFAEGKTLRELMRDGTIDRQLVGSIIRQLGSALGFAHRHGIIHRDMKPENIMVQTFTDGSVHVRLIDFGIASMAAASSLGATRIIGSLSYMAPEQLRGEVSTKSDVFSLGVLIFELLTGSLPFKGGDPLEIMERQRAGGVALPAMAEMKFKARIDSMVGRALAYEAEKRPGDASSFTDELAGYLALSDAGARVGTKTKTFTALIAAVLFIGVVLALSLFHKQRSGPVTSSVASKATVNVLTQDSEKRAATLPKLPELANVTLERANRNGAIPIDEHGALRMTQQDRFRLHVQSRSEGHLYLFSRSLESSDLHILFPSRTTNQGRSLFTRDLQITIPSASWFGFGTTLGNETLILIWSALPEPVLEDAKRFANSRDKGALPDGPAENRILSIMALPNSLKRTESGFQLVGETTACGWLTLSHK